MNIHDAFAILNIQPGHVTPADIKTAYRKASAKYHPDRNPAGSEMMKLINMAFEKLKNYQSNNEGLNNHSNYSEAVNTALNKIIGLGLNIEICGSWIWLSGNTKPHKEILKKVGFKWAPRKMKWHFRPEDYKCRRHKAWSMQKIYDKYGREVIEDFQPALPVT